MPSSDQLTSPEVIHGLALMQRLLARQATNHEKLLELIERKRDAIRCADIDAITELCAAEQHLAGQITALERRRLDLVEELTRRLRPEGETPLTISGLAEHADAEMRERLLASADELRERILQVRHESSVVAAAANALSRHITGVMQTINRALSRVGVYERRGRIAVGSQLENCVDVKS